MQEYTNKADYWGRFSGSYDKNLERVIGKDVRRNLARELEEERGLGNVVEFGCGTGYFTVIVARNASHVAATDASLDMLEAAKSRLRGISNVTFQVEDSRATSFPPETFDTALMANMLHTLDDPLKALRECYRVLKKGGTLLIINYTVEGMGRVERALLFFRFALRFGIPPKGHWPITSDSLRPLLQAAGFRIERMELMPGKLNALYVRARKD